MAAFTRMLPPAIAEEAASLEPGRFDTLITSLDADWKDAKGAGTSPQVGRTLKWVSVVNCFINTKGEFAIESISTCARVALDIILCARADLFVQVRWCSVLVRILHRYRRTLDMTIEWRPLLDLLVATQLSSGTGYEGAAMCSVHAATLTRLIRRARRYFPATAPEEIWAHLKPVFADVSRGECMEALGMLVLFMPTQHAAAGGPEWAGWLREWLAIIPWVPRCKYWQALWMGLISRLAKHDVRRVCGLEELLPQLFTHILWGIEVPVGSSSASPPASRRAPRECLLLFGSECAPRARSAAKIIVHSLRPGGGAQAGLEKLLEFLDPYYHPSNGGSWTNSLTLLLRYLSSYFMERVESEKSRYQDERPPIPGAVRNLYGWCTEDASAVLGPADRRAFAESIVRVASRAQFGKSDSLAHHAAVAMATVAYIEPTLVLPLVHARFEDALETVTATHQLGSALRTMAMCARPLLLAGEVPLGGEAEGQTVSSGDILAAALESTLPGLDANDPPKTLATIKLYCAVVSSVGVLHDPGEGGADGEACIPMYWSAWVEELLTKVFSLLSNLSHSAPKEGDGGRGGDSDASFLMYGSSMFRPLLELIFLRMPPDLYRRSLNKLASFVLTSTLPGVVAEAGVMIAVALWADPDAAAPVLVKPLAELVLSELQGAAAHAGGAGGGELSPALEGALKWQLGLLTAALHYGGHALVPYRELLGQVLELAFSCPSQAVFFNASQMLSAALGSLVLFYPTDQHRAPGERVGGGCNADAWVGKARLGQGPPGSLGDVTWHIPTEGERGMAEDLVARYLEGAAADLVALAAGGGGGEGAAALGTQGERRRIRSLLLRLEGCLSGLRTCLADFSREGAEDVEAAGAAGGGEAAAEGWDGPGGGVGPGTGPGVPLNLAGAVGVRAGTPGARERVAEALLALSRYIGEDDTETRLTLLRVMDATVNCGRHEYSDFMQSLQAWRTDCALLTQPAYADAQGGKKMRPRWLLVERAYLQMQWRASQAVYRCPGSRTPAPPVPPAAALALARELSKLAMHGYKQVRASAQPVLERCMKRFPVLVGMLLPTLLEQVSAGYVPPTPAGAAAPTGEAGEAGGSGKAADALAEERAMGACAVLSSRGLSRRLGRDSEAMASFMQAIMQTAHHESVKAQSAISDLFTVFALRFSRALLPAPAEQEAAGAGGRPRPPALQAVMDDLLSQLQGGRLHWRYSLMANTLLLFLLQPGDSPEGAAKLVRHFLGHLKGELPPLRVLGMVGVLKLIKVPRKSGGANATPRVVAAAAAAAAAVRAELEAQPGLLTEIVRCLGLNHALPDERGGGSALSRMSESLLGGEALTRAVASASGTREWPRTKQGASSVGGGTFSVLHTRVFKGVAKAVGPAIAPALRETMEAAAANPTDRHHNCAAAELVGGLIRAGVLETGPGSDWEVWMRGAVRTLLQDALPEAVMDWCCAVRYACGSTRAETHAGRAELLRLVLEAPPPGLPSGQYAKRFAYIAAALSELTASRGGEFTGEFQAKVMEELGGLVAHPSRQVREEVARCAAMICGVAGHGRLEGAGPGAGQHPAVQEAARDFAESLCTRVAASATAVLAGPGKSAGTSPGPASRAASSGSLSSMPMAIEEVVQDTEQKLSLGAPGVAEQTAWIETVLFWVVNSVKSGDSAFLIPYLLRLLPDMLRIQEPPDVDLATVAKQALAYLKYQIIPPDLLSSAAISLTAAVGAVGGSWHTRAAATVFIQTFAFRHAFAFAAAGGGGGGGGGMAGGIREAVESALRDPQLEVRELASTTLAGLLKGAGADYLRGLLARFAEEARGNFEASKRERKRLRLEGRASGAASNGNGAGSSNGGSAADSLPVRHAPLLGLSALVLSSPYDVPPWLPEALMAMAGGVNESPPIRDTVTKTFADFKRTHADTWAHQKAAFTSDQLEVLADLTLSPSYFV